MQALSGQVRKSGQVVADNLKGMYEVETKRDGSQNWTGYFIAPASARFNVGEHVEIALTTGQAKEVEVQRVNIAPTQITVSFVTPL